MDVIIGCIAAVWKQQPATHVHLQLALLELAAHLSPQHTGGATPYPPRRGWTISMPWVPLRRRPQACCAPLQQPGCAHGGAAPCVSEELC